MTDDHLHPKIRAMLALPKAERILSIKRQSWIGYPRAQEALTKLQELIEHPRIHRMPNLMIYGPTNNGKTMIVQRFMRDHPADDNPDGETSEIPVMVVQMPFAPEPRRFYRSILDQLFATYRHTDNLSRLETQVIRLLKTCGLHMLIVDELHNIVGARIDQQRQFLNLIRYLGNELQVPIVCLGLQSALRAIQIDEQLANRFEPFSLQRWSDGPVFRKLLNSVEATLPLAKRSFMSEDRIAETIIAMSEGTIGDALMLIRIAAIRAIETQHEKIDLGILDECGYLPPSERRRAAERAI
ncbi:MAG: TniB family NTP-binding protein [Phyllobacterium sp.]